MSYDSWLERPYQDRYDDAAAYEAWLESEDLDADEDHWDEFVQAMDDAAEPDPDRAYDEMRERDLFD